MVTWAEAYPGLPDAIAVVTQMLTHERDATSVRQYVADRLNEDHDSAAEFVSGLISLMSIFFGIVDACAGKDPLELVQMVAAVIYGDMDDGGSSRVQWRMRERRAGA
jgi:hypothetical protein